MIEYKAGVSSEEEKKFTQSSSRPVVIDWIGGLRFLVLFLREYAVGRRKFKRSTRLFSQLNAHARGQFASPLALSTQQHDHNSNNMKYLHDDRLAELTTLLTDCPLGGAVSQRVLHGRIEAYIMKRGTVDKKYAFKLGEKYVASLEHLAEDYSSSLQRATRKRSQSAGVFEEALLDSNQQQQAPPPAKVQRNRASSFDATRSELRNRTAAVAVAEAADPQQQEMQQLMRFSSLSGSSVPSALGDFAEQGTRRLMVRFYGCGSFL